MIESIFKNLKNKDEVEKLFPMITPKKKKSLSKRENVNMSLICLEENKEHIFNKSLKMNFQHKVNLLENYENNNRDISDLNFSNDYSENSQRNSLINSFVEKIAGNKKEDIDFFKYTRLLINANLIIRHKISKGEIYLGSNQYKYSIKNMEVFDVIIKIMFVLLTFFSNSIVINE